MCPTHRTSQWRTQTIVIRQRTRSRETICVHLSENDDATVIEALVCGNDDYDVEIEVTRAKNGRVRFDGFCDGPISYNCKHVAATLLAALSMDRLSQSRSRGSPARAR